MQMDLGSVILLGNSQTFVGIIATLVILCIARNTNNFIYEVLSDIKCEIVEYTKKLKPTVSLDSVKVSSDYKSIFLYSENEKHKKSNAKLYEKCKIAIMQIDILKFALQVKLTDWDKSIIDFADAIENKKEQQKGPMFAFAFCIVVFIFDELLRCDEIKYNQELIAVLTLFTIYAIIYWFMKWFFFMFKDDNPPIKPKVKKCKIKEYLLYLVSVRNLYQFMIHLLVTFGLLYMYKDYLTTNVQDRKAMYTFLAICNIPYFLFGLVHMFEQRKRTDESITMHYVYHFFYMLFLSIGIMFFTRNFIPQIMNAAPVDKKEFLFCLKIGIIGLILCVGLIFPFVCTLVKYNMVYVRGLLKWLLITCRKYFEIRKLRNEFAKLANEIKVE